MTDIGRVFLVGCPRSGTTLVQSMLAAHSGVHTLPETHFFARIIPNARWARRFGLTDAKVRTFLHNKLRETAGPDVPLPKGLQAWFVSSYGKQFARILDEQTVTGGKSAWVEKTPQHLHRISAIQRAVPGAKFIHILRNGRDTIASLYHVAREYPDRWGGQQPIDSCAARWVRDINVSRHYIGTKQHHFLAYDTLVENPEEALRSLCRFIGIDYQNRMLTESSAAYYKNVAEKDADWTGNAGRPLYQKKDGKFDTYLTDDQRSRIISAVNDAGLADLRTVLTG